MYVTHQRAYWTLLKDTGIQQPYPGKVEGFEKLKPIFGAKEHFPPIEENTFFDIAYLEERMKPAIEFAQKYNKELYCGEYGAIDKADLQSRMNYTRDTNTLFEKYKFGRALWSYKRMDFPSITENNEPISPELPKILEVK
jgi:hypothetical protein